VASHLSIEQDVTQVPDDVGQFDDLLPAFLKLGCDAVAPTDVPAHLQARSRIEKEFDGNPHKQYCIDSP